MLKNREIWESYLADNHLPSFMRTVREFDYLDFRNMVFENQDATEELIIDTLKGDVFILKNVTSERDARKLKEKIYKSGQQTKPSEFIPEDRSIPNYHTKSMGGGYKGGYDEVAHAYYYYRWNPDELGIFSTLQDSWDTIKVFNGLGTNGLKNNIPKDKIIDRVQVLHYPINSGEITTHCDAARWQITNFGINLTEKGVDFNEGGFYCVDEDENEVILEDNVKIGDGIFWSPSIFHGVKTPTGFDEINWEKPQGRWQLIMHATQSRLVENRKPSVSYEKFKENPEKVKEDYLFRGMNNA